MNPTVCGTVVGATALLTMSPLLPGAGFQLAERSATGLGRAYSGEAAIGDDASVIASNPAGMSLLGDTAVSAGLAYIIPGVDVHGSSNLSALGGPAAVPGSDHDVVEEAIVPFLFAARRINDKISAGFASFTQYGLATDYTPGAYLTDKSELTTINLNPSLSYRASSRLTLGVGVSAVYADAHLTGTLPASFGGPGRVLNLEGDDWGFGFNLGALHEFNDRTRIGLSYRSEVDLTLDGTGTNLLIPPGFGGPAVGVPATAGLTLPDSVELSIYHEISDRWAVHADLLWTGWSDFETLTADYGGDVPLINNVENWKDTVRLAAGATFRPNDRLTFRCGLAFDESPVPDGAHRTLRIPDGDRLWASLGASFQINPCYRIDLGYAHLFASDTWINEPAAGNGVFTGHASGDVDLVAAGVSGTF